MAFQNSTGLAVECFLDVLSLYLRSTYVKWETRCTSRSKKCDLLLDHFNKSLATLLLEDEVSACFGWLMTVWWFSGAAVPACIKLQNVLLEFFKECLSPLVLTHEIPGTIYWIS